MSKQQVPGFEAGFACVTILSIAVAVFGVWGWIEGNSIQSQKWLMSVLSLAVAFAIPTTAQAIGKSWASLGSLGAVMIFGLITAYSTHNGYVELIDKPAKAEYLASAPVMDAEAAHDKADAVVIKARKALDDFPALVIPPGTGPLTTKARTEAWEAQRAPLEEALDIAKADRKAAQADLDAKRNAYKSMAPDWAVWLAGALIDLGIVLAIFGFEATKVTVERQSAREADKAAQLDKAHTLLKDELDEEMEDLRQDMAFYRGLESEINVLNLSDHLAIRGEKAA